MHIYIYIEKVTSKKFLLNNEFWNEVDKTKAPFWGNPGRITVDDDAIIYLLKLIE